MNVINAPKVVEVSGTWDKVHQIEPSHDPKTLTKFTLFPKVPAELRIKIWRFAHPGPRILRLEYEERISHTVCRQTPQEILHACRGSRVEHLKSGIFFVFVFNLVQLPSKPLERSPIIYFDPGQDSL
jgi:hypothetical protein